MKRALAATIPILIFGTGFLGGHTSYAALPEPRFALPVRPSPIAPITVTTEGSSIYALYWTNIGTKFQLCLTALDLESRTIKTVDIAVEPKLFAVHQSMVAISKQQRLVVFYSLGANSTSSGRLTAVKLADLSISGVRKLDTLQPLAHWIWLESRTDDQPTLLGHPFGRDSNLAVCRINAIEMSCDHAPEIPLSQNVGTFASAGHKLCGTRRMAFCSLNVK